LTSRREDKHNTNRRKKNLFVIFFLLKKALSENMSKVTIPTKRRVVSHSRLDAPGHSLHFTVSFDCAHEM